MRKTAISLVAVLAATLTGCMTDACPAIGWSNSLTVELAGDASRVDVVEVCSEDVCSDQMQRALDEGVMTEVPPSTGAVSEEREPKELSLYSASRVDDDTWTIGFMMQAPTAVSVRALTGEGTVLAEEDFTLEWKRVGGSERCGGPGEAGPVVLEL